MVKTVSITVHVREIARTERSAVVELTFPRGDVQLVGVLLPPEEGEEWKEARRD